MGRAMACNSPVTGVTRLRFGSGTGQPGRSFAHKALEYEIANKRVTLSLRPRGGYCAYGLSGNWDA
jgi:hypothetical protein